ncbi:hypothetical protein [Lachnoclostridium phytofermentans]|uniref:hypothetical protein n=1 Tax=Lachnoclostridium phytofermentans TaxID=66219 RepID=UPI0005A19A4E|nr:hypothetical protein [Lachnoclostridium phytofermentans]
MKYNQKCIKYVTILLAFCILFVMLHLTIFSANRTYHYCPGVDCSVCQELQVVDNIVKQFSAAITTAALGISLVVFYKVSNTTSSCLILGRTLIMDKVRMDN